MSRTSHTIGAAVGAVLFMLFFAELAGRLMTTEPEPVTTVSAR